MQSFLKAFFGSNTSNKEEFGSFEDHRVSCEPSPPRPGEAAHINYQGLLKNAGANDVYLHYGFDQWNNVSTVKMNRASNGDFGAVIIANGSNEINVCFKDCAGNWDNNHSSNWTIKLQQ
jgi:hypothetical protein